MRRILLPIAALLVLGAAGPLGTKPAFVKESARRIPIAYRADVVVVGGSTGAVAAASAASRNGAKVFLAAPHPYLGEDMTATLRLWLEPGEKPLSPLARKIFGAGNPARPLHVKKTLDEELLRSGVRFLYSCYATDVLRDGDGNPCGVVIANRAGRQAVVGKVVIDATERAWIARKAGARFRPFPAGPQTFKRVVIGGEARKGENLVARKLETAFVRNGRKYGIIEYTLRIPMRDGTYKSWAEAEQIARDMTYHPDQEFASDMLFQVPPDPAVGNHRGRGEWPGVARLDIEAFRPAGARGIYILGGCADIPREWAAKLLRPPALIEMGTRIGRAAAREAASLAEPKGVHLAAEKVPSSVKGEVKEILAGLRSFERSPTIEEQERALPVLGRYDVVVIGGGTSGASAAIGAARRGAETLVVEYLYGLGGVGTQGAITKYYHGYRGGFTSEVCGGKSAWKSEEKMEWWRSTLRRERAEIWFGALGCGAFVEGNKVRGVVVATPEGRGVVLADVVIDSTGNADIAAAAGARCRYTSADDIAMQGTGLPPRKIGDGYTNTDFTITDETDMIDVTSLFVYAKCKYAKDAFDMGELVDTRERRRIVGDFTLDILDAFNNRTYPDTIAQTVTNYDTHGYTVHPIFLLWHPGLSVKFKTYIPYRCLLPKGLDGLLVTGLGISAHRDVIPLVRMQADLQNEGYAAGVAAAMASKSARPLRSIDIRALQKHLVEIGNLPSSVLTDRDSYPLPRERIAAAVKAVTSDPRNASVLLAEPKLSLPLLRKAYARASSEKDKLTYARILGIMGDPTGIETLISAVEAESDWDKGWNFRSQGQYGPNMSDLDGLIVALGRTGDRRAVPAVIAKVKLLDAGKDFSHHRAVALALERLGDPKAAAPLAELLSKPGMSGHSIHSIEQARRLQCDAPAGLNTVAPRRVSLREIILARALFRCGDKDGLGRRILENYTNDIRGHFARHAKAVLESGRKYRFAAENQKP